MVHLFSTLVLAVGGLFCLATSASSGLRPKLFAESLGLTIANPGGTNEIRAQYSGFFLVAGCLCLAAVATPGLHTYALTVLIVTFGGLLLGRVASLALNRGLSGFTSTIVALYAIDALGLSLSLLALWSEVRA